MYQILEVLCISHRLVEWTLDKPKRISVTDWMHCLALFNRNLADFLHHILRIEPPVFLQLKKYLREKDSALTIKTSLKQSASLKELSTSFITWKEPVIGEPMNEKYVAQKGINTKAIVE